jgi:septum formation protein
MRLYLASTSPARLSLLRSAGIEPVLLAPGVDEDAVADAAGPLEPAELVQLLARAKAEAVLGALVEGEALDGLILGGDSMFVVDGIAYGKPHTPEVARDRWRLQRGHFGVLFSGHWVIRVENGVATAAVGRAATASVHFVDDMSEAEIDAYIATGEPLQVAGAFTLDSRGAAFIDRIAGDPSTVVGLSLPLLRRLAAELGVAWPELWNR